MLALWADVAVARARRATADTTSVAAIRRPILESVIAVVSWGARRTPDPVKVGLYSHILSCGEG
jgi:hypothetical protein